MQHIFRAVNRYIVNRGGRLPEALHDFAMGYVRAYKNLNYDPATNGEYLLLQRLSALDIKTVFDVGANRGEYTSTCLSHFPNAFIHAFEILPTTYVKLQSRLGSSSRVRLNSTGLSNAIGSVEINHTAADDGITSLIEGESIHAHQWERSIVQVSTGDSYCQEHSIDTIDLLKIDVEGAEHLVLEGFHRMLAAGKVTAVQFEFGMTNIYSKFLLKDYWNLFKGHGFTLGPIMPNGIIFKDYDPRNEDFQGPPNFLAVHTSHADVIRAVRHSG
jgi:FkbM family methyltransferase